MTIRQSTSISVDLTANLITDTGVGTANKTKVMSNNLQLPVGGYTMGSIDIVNTDGAVLISRAGTAVIMSDRPVNIIVNNTILSNTKLFAYDGTEELISVSTSSTTAVTVEYVMGVKIVAAPGAPTVTDVTAGDSTATVAFNLSNDGGSHVTSFTVTSHPGNISAVGTTSPIVVQNLTNDTPYTFSVVASNRVGNSPSSAQSSSVTPVSADTAPDAPTIVDISMADNDVTIYFNEPINDGGSPIIQYIVTSDPGGFVGYGSESPVVVQGLSYGTEYTFTVQAENAVGLSEPSNISDPELPITLPAAPTITNVIAVDNTVLVEFTLPDSDGGSPITQYVVKSSPGNIEATGTESPITVSGLTYGTEYTFTVRAENAAGPSVDSDASTDVTPTVTPVMPSDPFITNVTPGIESAIIEFDAPFTVGSSPIVSYTITSSPDGNYTMGTSSPITFAELTTGVEYTFTIYATNSEGNGVTSGQSMPVTVL